MRAIIEAGFEAPTPIQEQAIPVLLQGHDLIGQAQTGTGKTAAFALPLAEKLDASQNHPQAIILLPTRELCIQVAQETHNLSKYNRLRVVPVYGGQPIDRQFRALAWAAADRGRHAGARSRSPAARHAETQPGTHGRSGRGRRDAQHGLPRRCRGDPEGSARRSGRPRSSPPPCRRASPRSPATT